MLIRACDYTNHRPPERLMASSSHGGRTLWPVRHNRHRRALRRAGACRRGLPCEWQQKRAILPESWPWHTAYMPWRDSAGQTSNHSLGNASTRMQNQSLAYRLSLWSGACFRPPLHLGNIHAAFARSLFAGFLSFERQSL